MSTPQQPKQERGFATRQALLQAGWESFESGGWEGATVREITTRAGVSTGTFYRYFSDTSALLHELAKGRYERLRASLRLEPTRHEDEPAQLDALILARMRHNVDQVIAYHAQAPGLHRVIEQRRSVDAHLDALGRRVDGELIQRACALLVAWGAPAGEAITIAFVLFHLLESCAASLAAGASLNPSAVADVTAHMAAAYLREVIR